MFYLLVTIACLAILGGAYALVTKAVSRPRSTKRERVLSATIDSLYRQAAQHVALGDPFAQIVMDEIDRTRERELP